MSDNREQGVAFGDLRDDLETESYPLSKGTLLDRYGDRTVEHSNGTSSLSSLLEPLGVETFESPEAVSQGVLNMIGEGAEGRTDYSDRGTAEAEGQRDQESF